jgi:hypothetical protein
MTTSISVAAPEMERVEESLKVDTSSVENVIFVVAGKIGLEAVEDKMLILIDKFRSGYECKDCNETGHYINCQCEREGTPGKVKTRLHEKECPYCTGSEVVRNNRRTLDRCTSCNGTGSTLKLPENTRGIPTSGVIVSIGPLCKTRKIAERVLFGSHTGYFLPFKGNAKIRCMREDEILCKVYSVMNNEVLGDFLEIEEQLVD